MKNIDSAQEQVCCGVYLVGSWEIFTQCHKIIFPNLKVIIHQKYVFQPVLFRKKSKCVVVVFNQF